MKARVETQKLPEKKGRSKKEEGGMCVGGGGGTGASFYGGNKCFGGGGETQLGRKFQNTERGGRVSQTRDRARSQDLNYNSPLSERGGKSPAWERGERGVL